MTDADTSTDAPEPATGPLRVGIVSDCYVPRLGGIEMQAHDLARNLTAAGHEVVVVTPTAGPDVVDGVRVRRMDVPLLPFDVPFLPSTFRLATDLLVEERVDVAHFHGGLASPMAYLAARRAQAIGIPTVITVHCMWSYAAPAFAGLDRLAHWSQWPVVLSAVSDVAAEPIRRIAGPGRPVVVLPNGIDDEAWRVEPVERDPTTVTLVSVMRLAPRKRPLQMLRMVGRVHAALPPGRRLRVIVIGDGPERPQLEKYLRTNGLSEVVDLIGRRTREEIRGYFARSDVFVAPANLESFGIAALEARCAGLPVVAKARTGIREFVTHEKEGLLARDDAEMVRELIRIVVDDDLRRTITTHNRSEASPVDWSVVVGRNVASYRAAIELMARRPAGGGRPG
ncbi:MAG: glycosyltransferase [Acidimicrobiales bacterium]|jgi:glycosyltransferase involved in cell wall biosynthesis|nr:glycosyltransferase [Acidimicrobiales bacterium]